ncbi:MAG TPA: hypothetical protein VNJ70_12615 [Thermoanaerobaculia bacterium]|nr:hypothetical protein [Thermoanaerobaculia bacterium]
MSSEGPWDPEQVYAARRRQPRLWPWLLLVAGIAAAGVALFTLLPRWSGRLPWSQPGGGGDSAGSGEAVAPRPRPPRPGAAELRTEGRREFTGFARAACTPHDGAGLQVALRTGAAELPVVALVVSGFDGPGSYTGRVFLTARGPRGALVRSTGAAELEVERRSARGRRSALAGRFEGRYAGAAGAGTLRGRFERCLFTAP